MNGRKLTVLALMGPALVTGIVIGFGWLTLKTGLALAQDMVNAMFAWAERGE